MEPFIEKRLQNIEQTLIKIETLLSSLQPENLSSTIRSFMTPDQIAKELNVDVQKVRRLIKSKRLRAYRVGKYLRVERKDVDAYLKWCYIGK
jgi:excisionase family DNA binding protein